MISLLLWPFSLIYSSITRLRNWMYDTGRFRSHKFEPMVISVGNLTVGGTGKTPMVEYLIRLLADKYEIATLSRGYKRKTKGFILANSTTTAAQIGDEPMQYWGKYGPKVHVSVGEDRALAIPNILFEFSETEVVLLDDAYQHRSVLPDLQILLTDFNRPFYKDKVLPLGRLREDASGARRADVIVVTKCPEQLTNDQKKDIINHISEHKKGDVPVFFTSVKYGELTPLNKNRAWVDKKNVILVAGIAQPQPLLDMLTKKYGSVSLLKFPDHHWFTDSDLDKIKEEYEKLPTGDTIIITTEKDALRLIESDKTKKLESLPIAYIPIETYFLEHKEQFESIILHSIQHKSR